MPNKEVVIVGAGVIGCSIAYHLAKQGVPSQIIERDSIAARASGKAWAIIVYPPGCYTIAERERQQPSDKRLFSTPEEGVTPWLELYWLGYHRLPDIAQDLQERGGIDIGYGELPGISVALSESEEKAIKENLSFTRGRGYEGYWIEEDDLKAIFPDINPLARGGKVSPTLQVEPYKYTLGLAQAAEKMGANFRQGEVVGFRHEGAKLTAVTLATGTEVEADVFVLATGPWSPQVTSHLGKEIPPQRMFREQCLRMQLPEGFPRYILSMSNGTSIVPEVSGSIIVGQTHDEDPQTSFDVPLTTEEEKMARLSDAIHLLPTINEAELIEQRGDFLAWPPSPVRNQPVIGRIPEWDNAYIATRMASNGMMLSPGVGQVMADLIMRDGKSSLQFKRMLDYLSPARLP